MLASNRRSNTLDWGPSPTPVTVRHQSSGKLSPPRRRETRMQGFNSAK